jgi:hypothetical protein
MPGIRTQQKVTAYHKVLSRIVELGVFVPEQLPLGNDDDVLNEDWTKYRMVRSYRLLPLVLVAIGARVTGLELGHNY